MLDVFQCRHPNHSEITLHDCRDCPDYSSHQATITRRNLLFHIYPVAGTSTWRRAVAGLRRRIDLFNGRRVVAIVTGPGLDPPEAVQAAFGDAVAEWIVLPNDPGLREVVTFVPLLQRVQSRDPNEASFYGHAKGVTRPQNPGATIGRWAQLCYETCLDYWPHVERTLQRHPVAGPFKNVGYGFQGSRSTWHYSGTFFWFRHAELFARDWPRIDRRWWGTESYLGLHFASEEAGCLFHAGVCPTLDLYSAGYLRGRVLPDYERWKKEHANDRTR